MMKLVGVGGGTGLSVLLRGLKQLSDDSERRSPAADLNLSAVVCVSDNGGSAGKLRQSFGIPAVGDLRNCLVALADGDHMLTELFQHRFSGGNGLQGHSLGNLIVTALFQMSGSLGQATELAREVLRSKGHVLPVTEHALTLCAEMESGEVIRGESQITAARRRITRVWLEPDSPPPFRGVLQALSGADSIILGPGSLYTSIIPNLLVQGVAEAVRNSQALRILVCNLMTQPGETDGFTAADHLQALENYLGPGVIDLCVMNSQPIAQNTEETYWESGSKPVGCDEEGIARMGVAPVVAELLAEDQAKVRHDPGKLARLIVSLTGGIQRAAAITSGRESLVA
jgi:uncharacterized cofD-like protein